MKPLLLPKFLSRLCVANALESRQQVKLLSQVLAPSKRVDALPPHMKRRAYLDLLLWSGFVELIPVSRGILIETAKIRAMARFKLPDAVHLASAIQVRCRYFVSADKDFDKMPEGIERVNCDHESLPRLLEGLS